MSLPKKDIIATVLVAVAAVLYVLWLLDATLPGMGGTRVTGLVVLALGFAASAVAVVPGFDALMQAHHLRLTTGQAFATTQPGAQRDQHLSSR